MGLSRIHIMGASGSGVTTLGRDVAARTGFEQLDVDDFFWLPTVPPFTAKRPTAERLQLLTGALDERREWVLTGSLMDWGDGLIERFDLVVFLYLPSDIRMARLAARERQRFGALIEPGGAMHAHHLEFMTWAGGYDTGDFSGRSLKRHEAWLGKVACPVLRLDGAQPPELLVERVVAANGANAR
jgi:adenylate kinase family enzyme